MLRIAQNPVTGRIGHYQPRSVTGEPPRVSRARSRSRPVTRLLKRRSRRGPLRSGRRRDQRGESWQDLSHDLRARVQSIAAAAAAGLEQDGGRAQRAALQDIAAVAAGLDLQLDSVLGEGIEAGEVFDPDHEVAHTCQQLQPLARRAHKRLILETHAEACISVRGNRAAFTRIVQNLITNAVRYAESDTVVVEMTLRRALTLTVRNVTHRLTRTDSRGLLTRRNRGSNARRTDAGATRGHGLGLAITHRLAEFSGGRMHIATRPGEFVGRVQLPVSILVRHTPAHHLHVRVQTPEPVLRAVLARQLRSAGMQVEIAARSPAAIHVLDVGTPRRLSLAELEELGDPPALRALCRALVQTGQRSRSVLLVDDNPLARARLLQLLGQLPSTDAVSVADAASARKLLDRRHFDHVIVDAHLGLDSGLELRDEIHKGSGRNRDAQVVVISAAPDATADVRTRPGSAAELARLLALESPDGGETEPAEHAELLPELIAELRGLHERIVAERQFGLDSDLHTLAGVARLWSLGGIADSLERARQQLGTDPDAAAASILQAISDARADG